MNFRYTLTLLKPGHRNLSPSPTNKTETDLTPKCFDVNKICYKLVKHQKQGHCQQQNSIPFLNFSGKISQVFQSQDKSDKE